MRRIRSFHFILSLVLTVVLLACSDPQMDDVDDVVLNYTFFKARRNTQGHYQPDADKAVVDKASGWEEYEHAPKVEDRGAVPSALPKPSKV